MDVPPLYLVSEQAVLTHTLQSNDIQALSFPSPFLYYNKYTSRTYTFSTGLTPL